MNTETIHRMKDRLLSRWIAERIKKIGIDFDLPDVEANVDFALAAYTVGEILSCKQREIVRYELRAIILEAASEATDRTDGDPIQEEVVTIAELLP